MASQREQIQRELADFCIDNGLNDSYGVIEGKQEINGKSVRTVSFCKAAILDGTITIYGPTFMVVSWTTTIRRLPNTGKEKCETVEQVKNFIKNNFVI